MTDVGAQEEAGDRLVRKLQQPAAGSEEKFVMTPRNQVLTAIAAFWLGMVATADAQQKLTITIVTQPFGTQPQFTKVDQPILRDGLKAKSNGQIDVKLSAWPEMSLNGPEVLRLIRAGQVDIGAAPLSTVSGDVPFLDGIDLAGLHPDIEQARKTALALIPLANKELAKFGSQIVAIYPFPAQVIWCRQPVSSLADLKGRKIRTFGASLNDFVTAIGAQPVSIGFPEVYSALERGVADCAVTGTGSGNAAKWSEVTSSIYNLSVGWAVAAYYVNTAWWNKLDQPTRDLISATMKEVELAQWKLGAEATQDGLDCNAGKTAGCKIHTLVTEKPMKVVDATAEDKATLKKIVETTIIPGWVKRCGARCGEIYNEVVAPITGLKFTAN
jgi:TRAP-type C4-dicarboxylate transport system substrate-binding protein